MTRPTRPYSVFTSCRHSIKLPQGKSCLGHTRPYKWVLSDLYVHFKGFESMWPQNTVEATYLSKNITRKKWVEKRFSKISTSKSKRNKTGHINQIQRSEFQSSSFKFRLSSIFERSIHYAGNKYMLFAGWEVRIVKNCDRGVENQV